MFIHEHDNWADFIWDSETVNSLQLQSMHRLGYLSGRMAAIGFDSQLAATVEAVTNDVVASSEIEGVRLDTDEVRSSVARKFGVSLPTSKDPTHYVEGIVEMMLDATHNQNKLLTEERLYSWHHALFPNKTDISVGAYRTDEMSVVSGTLGRERIHYRAPSPDRVPVEMANFIKWINNSDNKAGILKSAIAHLWFVSIHPFDDGNGRIGRAISDMVLAELDGDGMHFYSLSRQILKDKNHYYKILERTQRGNGDITEWLIWYFNAFMAAVDDSNAMLSLVLRKATFWHTHSQASMNNRQRMVINKYLDGYDAKLTAKNWEKIAGVSKDTALRDIAALVNQGILLPTPGKVRDVPYSINYTKPTQGKSPFSNILIEKVGQDNYITAQYKDSISVRDRISTTDKKRLEDGEITMQDLLFKHFAYLLE
ncbi:MAG: Fic family protein [Muribaculaceae bacterium]|nr:Fic family protein [Muribaculaceae bacterium]